MRRLLLVLAAIAALPLACGGPSRNPPAAPASPAPGFPATSAASAGPPPTPSASSRGPETLTTARTRACGGGKLRVHFYNVSQALSALVDLPDGRHILVDTGDSPKRPGCGTVCAGAHSTLVSKLTADLAGQPIDLLWITHQHSDHIGGATDIIERFVVRSYVDNGRDLSVGEIRAVRDAASAKGVPVTVVEPGHEQIPLRGAADVKVAAIAPTSWLPTCTTDRNECSILLRIDYCSSSILFTGDAEVEEEALLNPRGTATLVQVGHHGSGTSSGASFLAAVQPRYAVISAGKPDEGENRNYCHPTRGTVEHVTHALGGPGSRTIPAFDGAACTKGASHLAQFVEVAASDTLWATERDGDIVLTTSGDGTFQRE